MRAVLLHEVLTSAKPYDTRDGTADRPHRERRSDAIHVEAALSLSADDTDIAAYAHEESRVVLTNDDDFLNVNKFPEITVFYYPDNELPEYELAAMVTELITYYPTQADLPRVVFVTEEYQSNN